MVLPEGPAQTGTYRGSLPAPDLGNRGLLSSIALPETDTPGASLVRRSHVSWLPFCSI
jgi:hypothetical protein